jgi:hypothetical protein
MSTSRRMMRSSLSDRLFSRSSASNRNRSHHQRRTDL